MWLTFANDSPCVSVFSLLPRHSISFTASTRASATRSPGCTPSASSGLPLCLQIGHFTTLLFLPMGLSCDGPAIWMTHLWHTRCEQYCMLLGMVLWSSNSS